MCHSLTTDIAIIGAGPVGLALAGWLLHDNLWRVTLIDSKIPETLTRELFNHRALALSEGSRILLKELCAWPQQTTPIHTIHISQQGVFGKTLIRHSDYGYPALGYVSPYQTVLETLKQRLLEYPKNKAFNWWQGSQVKHIIEAPDHLQLDIMGQYTGKLHASLVVHAEGSLFHQQNHQNLKQRDYQQTALLSTVTCEVPRQFWAWERFTKEGPLALLPFTHHGDPEAFSLVWVTSSETAQRHMQLSDQSFLAELTQVFGLRMGQFKSVGQRKLYPLILSAVSTPVQGLRVAIGNAAQTLHPVAGQGLNLGLRDARCLATILRRGLNTSSLAHFKQARYKDRYRTITITDFLPRIFSTECPSLKYALGGGLAAIDMFSPIRNILAQHMMFGHRA